MQEFHPAWQVVHISRNGHILDIKVLPAICQLPGVDVVDHGAEGVGVHVPDVDVNTKGVGQWTGLMFACLKGYHAIVSRLVQVSELDINYQAEDVDTAAHLASMFGHTECVRILAESGRVDWNKRDKYSRTPLYLALVNGHSDIVDIIVHQPNIDYNVKTVTGATLAEAAVRGGNVKSVKTLTAQERFDCWNVPDSDGDTPIMWALKYGIAEIVDILLRCPRVDLNCRDKDGWSLVFRAVQYKKLGENISIFFLGKI